MDHMLKGLINSSEPSVRNERISFEESEFKFEMDTVANIIAEDMNDDDPTTKQLAEWLVSVGADGDHHAFESLFAHFAPRVKVFMMRSGATVGEAEDLAQETMVQVWRKAALYDASRSVPSTWIFRVARNLRIDRIRRQKYHEVELTAELDCDSQLTEEDRIINQLDAVRLEGLIDTLPADQVEIVRLAFFDGLSHSEISKRLSIPLGTVKSRIRLAFGKLRKAMGG